MLGKMCLKHIVDFVFYIMNVMNVYNQCLSKKISKIDVRGEVICIT